MRINETPIALTHSKCHTVAEPILELIVYIKVHFVLTLLYLQVESVKVVLITGFQREHAN